MSAVEPDSVAVQKMVLSHEKLLFGYYDAEAIRYIPGLLARMDQSHQDIADVKVDISNIKASITEIPQISTVAKTIKKLGYWATGSVILLLLAIITRQYGLIPAIISLFVTAH